MSTQETPCDEASDEDPVAMAENKKTTVHELMEALDAFASFKKCEKKLEFMVLNTNDDRSYQHYEKWRRQRHYDEVNEGYETDNEDTTMKSATPYFPMMKKVATIENEMAQLSIMTAKKTTQQ